MGFSIPFFEVFGSVPTETYPVEAEKIMLNKCNMESTAGCCFSMLLNLVAVDLHVIRAESSNTLEVVVVLLLQCVAFSLYISQHLVFQRLFFFPGRSLLISPAPYFSAE